MKAARASCLMALKREAAREGVSRGDEAYMRSVTRRDQGWSRGEVGCAGTNFWYLCEHYDERPHPGMC